MSISVLRLFLVVATSFLLVLVGCSDDDDATSSASAGGLLQYISADTPYVFATLETMPEDVADKLRPQLEATLSAYQQIIRAVAENAYAEARENDEDLEWFETVMPFVDELEDLMSVDGFAEAGIDRDSRFAFYGAGVLPVIRVTLSDEALMEATIKRLETKAGEDMKTATIDGHSYRYVGDDEARIVIAVIDGSFLLTMVPTSLPEDEMKQVLGVTLPAANIADAGALASIARKYSYDDYLLGFFDIEGLVNTFIEPQAGINAEILSMMDYDGNMLSDVCKVEIKTLAGIMPRIVSGYTDINVDRITSSAVFELREDIATAMTALTAPVPGLGSVQNGMFSFGMSMDLLALREFYSDRLDALEASPFKCEHFAEFQSGVSAGRDVLNQPVPPIVYGFKGFLATIESIEGLNIAAQQPPTSVDMRLLIAMENAEGLLAMGAMFSPEFAALNLEPNGKPVRLSLPQIDAFGQVVHVALTDDALAVSVGDGMEDELGSMIDADAADDSPFIFGEMDASAYSEFVSNSMLSDVGDANEVPEIREAVAALNAASQALMDRLNFAITFSDHGVEIGSELTLKD